MRDLEKTQYINNVLNEIYELWTYNMYFKYIKPTT